MADPGGGDWAWAVSSSLVHSLVETSKSEFLPWLPPVVSYLRSLWGLWPLRCLLPLLAGCWDSGLCCDQPLEAAGVDGHLPGGQ